MEEENGACQLFCSCKSLPKIAASPADVLRFVNKSSHILGDFQAVASTLYLSGAFVLLSL